ncbi:hypothetical protein Bca52824_059760 [Brassica carinata]|uniref:Uncharacterized protein n=1 Tax=Brassica carinata TaxID=52824 RepID=A0A8X7QV37_BRACI|nr:hypothetical protein Bca52824_059760 [Brassica carinata]
MVSGSDATADITTASVLETDHGSIYDYYSQKEPRLLYAGNYMRHNSRTSSAKLHCCSAVTTVYGHRAQTLNSASQELFRCKREMSR